MKRLSFASLMLFALVTSSVSADPRQISDEQLDQITAGTAGENEHLTSTTGGNIIAGEAIATITGESTVSLQDNAQSGARALSLVSSADAAVANGVNLWDGAVHDLGVDSGINVLQSNELLQDSTSAYARLQGYERDEGTLHDVQVWTDSAEPEQNIEFGLHLDITDVGSFDGQGQIPASVIPGAKLPGSFGNVVGFAGDLGIDYDGGFFETGFDLESSVSARAHLDATTTSSLFWGLWTISDAEFDSFTEVGASFNPYLTIGWEFPDISISGTGAVCYANGGECRSSVLDRDIAALYLPWSTAEHIVIDRSGLVASNDYSVGLGVNAQAGASAVTLVNTAGGLLANGVNLATSSDTAVGEEPGAGTNLTTSILQLDQDNLVAQNRGGQNLDRYDHPPHTPGGSIVANESSANLIDARSVIATDSAQAGAHAVTLVNSADTLIGTGVNLWDGRLQSGVVGNRIDIDQVNDVVQIDGQTVASLHGFERGPESYYNAWTHAKSDETPKFLGTEFTLDILEPGTENTVASLTGNLNIPASIIPTSKVPGIGGTSAAFAGNVDFRLDGGSADLAVGIRDSGLHFLTRTDVEGGGDLGIFYTNGTGWYERSVDATINAALDLHIDMPDLDIEVDGAVCFAQKGNCEAGVSDRQIGSLDLEQATAEYIVLDRSGLDTTSMSSVMLADGAQADARAVNLFNTAGGAIAGGTNIASWRGEENSLTTPLLNLAQENDVVQTPGVFGQRGLPGGMIVAYESIASVSDLGAVAILNNAQRGARALSLVNSADTVIANGLNVWSGNLHEAVFDDSINVSQDNFLVQELAGPTAMLGAYRRDDERSRLTTTSVTTNASTPPPSEIFPAVRPGHINGEVDLTVGDFLHFNREGWVPTSIIPTSKIPGSEPGGVAFAGNGYLHYDGGSVTLTSTAHANITTSTDLSAEGEFRGLFNLVSTEGTTTYTENSSLDVTTNLEIFADFPDLTIDVTGAGCIAKGANCTASHLEREDGALNVRDAMAEYVVLDRSTLAVTSDYSVLLGDYAQAEAEALLILNAAGGHVANGLNIARIVANELTAQPNLAQSNVILQGLTLDDSLESHYRDETAAGGAIVAGESMAAIDQSASVNLDEFAQDSARALLLVNSADALVANGINVWHGDVDDEADFGQAINLGQTNQIVQYVAPVTASLNRYERDSGSLRHAWSYANSVVEPEYIRAGFDLNIGDDGDILSYYEGLNVPANAIPSSRLPGAPGIVTGFAGEIDVTYGGGSVDVLFGIDTGYSYSNNLHSSAAGGALFDFGEVEGTLDYGIDEFLVRFAPSFYFTADLPTLEIHADGALCWANGGTCEAGVREENRGAVSIDSAEAENVVVDRSVLETTERYVVALDHGAQANVQAMAIVNAAGGLVANGINVSNLRGATLDTSTINVVQRNVIVQGRK